MKCSTSIGNRTSRGILVLRVAKLKEEKILSNEEKQDEFRHFERRLMELHHKHCKCCRMVGLSMVTNQAGTCSKCQRKGKDFYLRNNALPVWRDRNGRIRYDIPPELKGLTCAEQMLIQRISPFVPLYHIKNGIFGLSGHVCAFEQDIEGFTDRLPRKPDDIAMLKVLKTIKAEIGREQETYTKAFKVRKKKVLGALFFLKVHHSDYKNITIHEQHLDWMKDETDTFEGLAIETDEIVTFEDDNMENADMGPAPKQAIEPRLGHGDIGSFGFIDEGGQSPLSEHDKLINKSLQDSVNKSPNRRGIAYDWPERGEVPVSEYGNARIFTNAFPWLFPGGIGDVRDFPDKDIKDWGKLLLYYEDGRFATDRLFSFFALNYITRHRNNKQGQWFVKEFQHNCPDNLDDLKALIEAGDTSFVNCLTYFNQRIKGSSPYWFKKRCELYSWIYHHVEAGNGAPNFFITLSCAEYFWPDIADLIRNRMTIAGEDTSKCYIGSREFPRLVNKYSLVVQEYFQKRVEIWLETVGKTVFGIKHFWVRYEFAPGRGQIHAHLLAIAEETNIHELCHLDLKETDGEAKRAQRLGMWASEKFGMTATVCNDFDNLSVNDENTPVKIRFTDVGHTPGAIKDDQQRLMFHVQVHQCSNFCLRKSDDSEP